jgi:hypothetical protein
MMIKRSLVITTLLFLSLCIKAQTAGMTVAADTIIKLNGSVLAGDITTVTPTYIKFTTAASAEEYTIERKEVQKVIYKSGRIEVFNQAAFQVLDEGMWEAVWLTDKQSDVSDLYMLGEIEATSPSSARSASAAQKGAIIKAQKKAANMSGTVILVTKKQNTGGYGEYPGYIIKGIVYGPEPPKDMPQEGESASN